MEIGNFRERQRADYNILGKISLRPTGATSQISRAIHFQSPPRLPVTMGCFGVDDTGWVGLKAPEGWTPASEGEDQWHCVWERTEMENMGQVKGHPIEDIGKLSAFRPPDYRDPSRYVDMAGAMGDRRAPPSERRP